MYDPDSDAVCDADAREPASERPILMAMIGLPSRRAFASAAMNAGPSRTVSQNSMTACVFGSSTM